MRLMKHFAWLYLYLPTHFLKFDPVVSERHELLTLISTTFVNVQYIYLMKAVAKILNVYVKQKF